MQLYGYHIKAMCKCLPVSSGERNYTVIKQEKLLNHNSEDLFHDVSPHANEIMHQMLYNQGDIPTARKKCSGVILLSYLSPVKGKVPECLIPEYFKLEMDHLLLKWILLVTFYFGFAMLK